jgi:phosphoglycolate phosphatase-like HAD superfamily hydrolase
VKIGIDFDGVAWSVVDSLGHLEDCPPYKGQRLSLANCDSWDTVVEIWGKDVAFAMAKLDEARHIDRLRHFGLFEGFDTALNSLKAMGHEPVILTHNNDEAITHIKEFLVEQGLGDVEVVKAKPAEKIQWCLDNGSPVLVDDAPDTIRAAAEAGLTPIAPRYLYNAAAIDEVGAVWGHGWSQLLPLIITSVYRHDLEQAPAPAQAPPAVESDLSL